MARKKQYSIGKLLNNLYRDNLYPDIVSLFDSQTAAFHLEGINEVLPPRILCSKIVGADPYQLLRVVPSKQAFLLKNVKVWLDTGIVTTIDGKLIAETLPSHYRFVKMLRAGAYSKQNLNTKASVEVESMSSIGGGKWFGNYYHRLIDEIPRMWSLFNSGYGSLIERLYLPSTYADDLIDYAKLLLNDNSIIHISESKRQWAYAHRYVFSPLVAEDYCGYLPREFVEKLRTVLKANYNISDKPENKIYITRKYARHRRVINEDDVVDLLKREGFEIVCADAMSIDEQIKVFSSAYTIVGSHGAGLSNMIFSNYCKVVEFFPGEPYTHYRWLATSLGHSYMSITGTKLLDKHSDYKIPLGELEKHIKS